MRPVWQDIAAVEDTLPTLQEVSNELAAALGNCTFSIACSVCSFEISLACAVKELSSIENHES